jgi:hypothetical protein
VLLGALSHYPERRETMSILTDPDQIEHFRLLTLWRGLGLELKGMKMSRGTSCYKILKSMGMTGNKQQVHTDLGKLLGKIPESV